MNPCFRATSTAAVRSILLALTTSLVAAEVPSPVSAPEARRLLFLGDSITYAGQYVEFVETFLRLRFPDWPGEILNLGLPSETVSGLSEAGHAGGAFPRPDLHERLDRVLAQTQPDLVFACYGMNDGIYLPLSDERFAAFQDGLRRLRAKVAASQARLVHLTPPVFDPPGSGGPTPPAFNYNDVLDRYSEWLLARRSEGWAVVDLHGPMNRHLAEHRRQDSAYRLAGDGVHPGDTGHWVMAQPILRFFGAPPAVADADSPQPLIALHPNGAAIFKLVQQRQRLLKDTWLTRTGHQRPGMNKGLSMAEAQAQADALAAQIRSLNTPTAAGQPGVAPFPGPKSGWNGFDRYDFAAGPRTVSVIVPKQPRPGRLWAWKGEFLDAFPAVEIELLNRGVYIVYLAAPDLLGSPEAVKLWDTCYEQLTQQHQFAPRPALIALSRAGLYCYNWAAVNPQRVACLYADAAVCDFKSWPGGRGKGKGSPRDWALVLEQYGFKTDADALAYPGNPIDRLAPLARHQVPLLHVYGDADDVVPWDENTGLIAKRYRELGGEIQLIAKPGVGHHPHGLPDPTPIVEFILKHLTASP